MKNFQSYNGSNVLVLGGLGFLGSSLAIRLVELGANVTIVDAMMEEYGGNLFNIDTIKSHTRVNFNDIRDEHAMGYIVRDMDYIFHSAAQVCHLKSLENPYPDIDINIRGTAVLMESLRKFNKDTKVIKLGSRGQYGTVTKLPADEDSKTEPKGIYEISLLAAEHMLAAYFRNHGIRCVMTRLTNIYGPRAQMRHNSFGVANWFIRLAIDNEKIQVFGNGEIKRDFLYVDDCVDALLGLALDEKCDGHVFNIGRNDPSNFKELAQIIIAETGTGEWGFAPFSPERKAQEPGDYYTDYSKINTFIGWHPTTALRDGVKETVKYYKRFKQYYW